MQRFTAGVLLTDLVVLSVATLVAMLAKFGFETSERTWGPLELTYAQFGLVIALLWWWLLALFESRDRRVLGEGLEEYRRIGRATAYTFGAVAVFSVVVKLDFSRGYIAVALPLGLAGLLGSRVLWRWYLRRCRSEGGLTVPALIVGGEVTASRVSEQFRAYPEGGFRCVGTWQPENVLDLEQGRIHRDLVSHVEEVGARALVITEPHSVGAEGMRALSWGLGGVDILVSPHFVDVAPERVRVSYSAGQAFIRLEEPQFARARGLMKGTFDRIFALSLLVLFSPLLLLTAVAVKCDSRGPVLYGHRRVGRDGKPFIMWKFRSMRVGADQQLAELLASNGSPTTPLFKVDKDPRITNVGRFIRRTSLDELPQLVNVLLGSMSLVGPRPQVEGEVALYQGLQSSRLRVLPGITGLWQVSGRSDLTWEEASRLDLYYVENWSMLVDLVILWRTVGVVLRGDGAR